MHKVELTQGKVAFIDKEDLPLVAQSKWSVNTGKSRKPYAQARRNGRLVLMHRVIIGITDPMVQVDHIDGNGLNNQRSNLRICSKTQNMCNRGKNINNTSGYKGVHWYGGQWYKKGIWRARITVNKKEIHLGYFSDPAEAYAAYCAAAIKYHKEFAHG